MQGVRLIGRYEAISFAGFLVLNIGYYVRVPPDLGVVCAVPQLVEDVKHGSPGKRAKCLDESWGISSGFAAPIFSHSFHGLV